jgi:hypothetical protein
LVSNQNVVWISHFRHCACFSHLSLLIYFQLRFRAWTGFCMLHSSLQKAKRSISIFFQDYCAKASFLYEQLS